MIVPTAVHGSELKPWLILLIQILKQTTCFAGNPNNHTHKQNNQRDIELSSYLNSSISTNKILNGKSFMFFFLCFCCWSKCNPFLQNENGNRKAE